MPKLKNNPLYILGNYTALPLDKHNRSVDDGRIRAMVGLFSGPVWRVRRKRLGKKSCHLIKTYKNRKYRLFTFSEYFLSPCCHPEKGKRGYKG